VPDLVARYPMDALGGGTVPANLVAYAGNCTMCPAMIADGAHDGAYRFDGTQWFDLPAISETFVGAAPFTITLWIRTIESNTDRGVVAQPSYATGLTDSVAITQPSTTTISFESTPNGLQYEYLDANPLVTVNDGAWHFIAARWDGATKRITVDGKTTLAAATQLLESAQPIVVGADRDSMVTVRWMSGDLDDLRFYGRTLTDAELAVIRSSSTGT